MIKKRFMGMTLLLFVVLMLTGCDQFNLNNDIHLTLKVDGDVYEQMNDLVENTSVSLPIVTKDDQVFMGWSDGESTYQSELIIKKSIQLEAVFDDILNHFTYSVVYKDESPAKLIQDTIQIDSYIGHDDFLVVPQKIDGKFVSLIAKDAFKDSTVVEIHVPADVKLANHAFYNAVHLESFRYYGELEIPYEDTYNHLELNDVLSLNVSTCSQNPDDRVVDTYPFGESCPIKEISHIQSLNIGGQIYTNYRVVLDPSIPKDFNFSWTTAAFDGATNLHTIEIPKADTSFFTDSLLGTSAITTILIDDAHPYFSLIDGILFSKDLTRLIYYPSGKKDTTYTLPSGVTYITGLVDNAHIETLDMNDYVGNFPIRGMTGLKEILVRQSNSRYQSVDGVLYEGDTLISYPANKPGTAFVVPNGITKLGNYAFYNNQHLESIDLNQVTRIDFGAFMASQSITELHLPSTVVYVDSFLLAESSITKLIINRSFIVDGTITALFSGPAFDRENLIIYVKDDSLEAYKTADYWKNYTDIIHPISEYVD